LCDAGASPALGDGSPLSIDKCRVTGYTYLVVLVRSFAHKGLRKLYTDDIAKGVPPDSADKLRKMLSFFDNMQDPEELRSLPSWKAHLLTGDRKGTWSLSVSRNLRLTFWVDFAEHEIPDVNLEDYH